MLPQDVRFTGDKDEEDDDGGRQVRGGKATKKSTAADGVDEASIGDVEYFHPSSGVQPFGRTGTGGGAMIEHNRDETADEGADTAVSVRDEALFGASEEDREKGVSPAGKDGEEDKRQTARWQQEVLSALAQMRKANKEQSIKLAEQVKEWRWQTGIIATGFLTLGVWWRRSSEHCVDIRHFLPQETTPGGNLVRSPDVLHATPAFSRPFQHLPPSTTQLLAIVARNQRRKRRLIRS